MCNKKTWLHAVGVAALTIGASAATLGGTLAAFPDPEESCQGDRATHPFVAGRSDETHRPLA